MEMVGVCGTRGVVLCYDTEGGVTGVNHRGPIPDPEHHPRRDPHEHVRGREDEVQPEPQEHYLPPPPGGRAMERLCGRSDGREDGREIARGDTVTPPPHTQQT